MSAGAWYRLSWATIAAGVLALLVIGCARARATWPARDSQGKPLVCWLIENGPNVPRGAAMSPPKVPPKGEIVANHTVKCSTFGIDVTVHFRAQGIREMLPGSAGTWLAFAYLVKLSRRLTPEQRELLLCGNDLGSYFAPVVVT